MKHTISYQIDREDQENLANIFYILTLKNPVGFQERLDTGSNHILSLAFFHLFK